MKHQNIQKKSWRHGIFVLLSLLLFLTTSVNAQMRVGGTTAPNPNAILDLNRTDGVDDATRGLALPRVNLTSTASTAPLAAHVKGMYVYNVATAGDVTPGVYYSNGTKWVRVVDFSGIGNIYQNFGDSIAYYFSQTNLGDTVLNYITNNVTQELTDSIMANVTVSGTRGITIAGSGTSNIDVALPPGAAGQVLTFDGYNWFPATRGFDHDDIIKITNEIKYYLTLGGKLYSAGNNVYFTNDTILNASAKAIGDSLLSSNSFVIQFGDSLAYYFTQTKLGDTIVNNLLSNNTYITNLLDTLKSYLEDGNTLYTAGYGLNLNGTEFSADAKAITDSVVNYIINNTTFGDSILSFIAENINNTTVNLGDEILNYITNNINNTYLGDTILQYITNNFPAELGDTILQYIINNVTQELTDSIFANVEGIRGITVENGANGKIEIGLPAGSKGQILVYDNKYLFRLREVTDSLATLLAGGVSTPAQAQLLIDLNNRKAELEGKVNSGEGDEWVAVDASTIAGTDTTLIKEIVKEISKETNIIQLGDSLAYYFSQTVLGDTIANNLLNNNQYITNLIDTLAKYLEDNNTLYTAGYGLNLNGTEFSANAAEIADSLAKIIVNSQLGDSIINLITNNIDNPAYNLGDEILNYITNNISQTQLGDTILQYITNNFPDELGDTILQYITNNVTQELTNEILANVSVASADNSVTVTGSGTSDIDLSVNIETVADSLAKIIVNSQLGDSIINLITNNIDNPAYNLGDEILNYITNNISQTQLGDTILQYITNNFPAELGDTILQYITNNVTQELTNEILANVSVASADNSVTVTGSGTSDIDLSVNINNVADSLAKIIINSQLGDSIINLITNNIDNPTYNLGDEILNYITNNIYQTSFGDTIMNYITNNFSSELGDTILNYITNNVTQELTDSIFANVEGIRGITVGNGANGKIEIGLPTGSKGQILVYDNKYLFRLKEVTDSLATLLAGGVSTPAQAQLLIDLNNRKAELEGKVNSGEGDEWVAVDASTIAGTDTTLIKEIVKEISKETNIIQLGDSLAYYFSQTVLGDTIANNLLNNNQYITNLIDTLAKYLEDNNTLYTAGYGLNLDGTEFSANLQELADSLTSETYITQFGDSLAYYLTETRLGDTISHYLTENNEFITNVTNEIQNLLEGDGNTLYTAGYGLNLDGTEFSANLQELADSLTSETYITQFGDSLAYYLTETRLGDTISHYLTENNEFITNVTNEIKNYLEDTNTLYTAGKGLSLTGTEFSVNFVEIADSIAKNITNTILGDTILNYITNNITNTNLGNTILQYITNNFGDALGDTILNYITNNVTQELTDSIMANVNIASADNTVTVTGSGTSNIDLSVNITNIGDSLAANIDNSSLKDTIISLVKENSAKVKRLEIALNETIGTQSKFFFGTTSNAAQPVEIVSIEPIWAAGSDLTLIKSLLKVTTSILLNGNVVDWSVMVENDNINSTRSGTLAKVVISYISESDLTTATNGYDNIVGR